MTTKRNSNECRLPVFAVVLSLAAWGGIGIDAAAQQRTTAPRAVEVIAPSPALFDLERAFWRCDHAATTQMIDTSTAAACSAITEELRKAKFSGDFDALLTWWQANKPAEHAAFDAELRASTGK